MAILDKINVAPTYTMTLPSNGEEVMYRPYLHKEEKVLMLAKETGSNVDYLQAVKDTIRACTFGQLDIDTLPSFDIEELFLRIRGKSSGEIVNFNLICQHPDPESPDKLCETSNPVSVTLSDINIDRTRIPEGGTRVIELTLDVSIEVMYPTFDTIGKLYELKDVTTEEALVNSLTDIVASTVRSVITKDDVIQMKDLPKEEVRAFLDNMTSAQIESIIDTVTDVPTIQHDVTVTCSKCGQPVNYTFTGIYDFFV